MSKPVLHTARLDLVPLERALLEALDQGVAQFATALGATVAEGWPQADFAETLPSIRRWLDHDPSLACWTRCIVLRGNPRVLLGEIGSKGPPDTRGLIEIGYALLPDARRQGYASEAATAFSNWALARDDVHGVVAETIIGNDASERVLQRAGFRLVGLEANSRWWEKR